MNLNKISASTRVFFTKNLRKIVLFFFALCFVFIIIYSYLSYREQKEMNIANSFYPLEKEYNNYISNTPDKKWINSLNKALTIGDKNISYNNGQRIVYLVATTYYKEKNYKKAQMLFKKLIDADSSFYGSYSYLFLASMAEKSNRAEAVKLLEEAKNKYKKTFFYPRIITNLGRNYILMKDYKSAKKILSKDMNNFKLADQTKIKKLLAYVSINE